MASDPLYKRLIARAGEVQAERKTTDNTWQEIADNLFGRRDFTVVRTKGEQRLREIYDGTSKNSGSRLAGAMHTLLTSPASRWFGLGFEDPRLQDDAEAAEWLDLAEKRMDAALSAPEANFHAQLSETYFDLIAFGTGALFIDDVPGQGVRFSARPLQELYLAEDPSGRIDTIARLFPLTARQAVDLWGDRAKSATKSLDGDHSEDRNNYWHIIVPNDDIVVGKLDATGMPWASFFLSPTDSGIMSKGGYHEMPMATPRWEQDAGEVYGRGPGWNALADQKMVSEMKKVTITAGQLSISPPLMVDSEGVLPGDLRFHPKAIIPINATGALMSPPIQPLETGSNFNIGEALIGDTRSAVQDSFLHELVQAIPRDPRMTATQVLELSAQTIKNLAPILGRLQTELLEPIIERVFAIEVRAGRMPPPPPQIGDLPLKIDYVSPVAKAQQSSDARAIIDFSGIVTEWAQTDPSVLHVADLKQGARELGEKLGVPVSMIRDSAEVEKRLEAEAQLAAEQKEQADLIAATDQMAKLAKAAPQQGAA